MILVSELCFLLALEALETVQCLIPLHEINNGYPEAMGGVEALDLWGNALTDLWISELADNAVKETVSIGVHSPPTCEGKIQFTEQVVNLSLKAVCPGCCKAIERIFSDSVITSRDS